MLRGRKRESYLLIVTVILWFSISALNINFAKPAYFLELIQVNSVYIICALGVLPLMILGEFDLSIGGVIGLTSVVLAWMNQQLFLPMPLLFLLGGIIGSTMGWMNGKLVGKLKVSSVVVTLATMYVFYGLSGYIYQKTLSMYVFEKVYKIQDYGGWIETISIISMLVLTYYILRHTFFGRSVYALGGDSKLAKEKGFYKGATLMKAHIFSGMSGGLAAAIHLMMFNQPSVDAYINIELELIIIIILGGLNVLGGYGTVFGTFVATVFIVILRNGLVFIRIPVFFHDMIIGALIILILAYGIRAKRLR